MQIILKGTHLDLTQSLRIYIEKKMGPLVNLVKRIDAAGSAEFEVEVSRTTTHHHKGPVFRAEAHLRLPKKTFYVAEESYDIRAAIDVLKARLRQTLERYKEKELTAKGKARSARRKK